MAKNAMFNNFSLRNSFLQWSLVHFSLVVINCSWGRNACKSGQILYACFHPFPTSPIWCVLLRRLCSILYLKYNIFIYVQKLEFLTSPIWCVQLRSRLTWTDPVCLFSSISHIIHMMRSTEKPSYLDRSYKVISWALVLVPDINLEKISVT